MLLFGIILHIAKQFVVGVFVWADQAATTRELGKTDAKDVARVPKRKPLVGYF